MRRSGRAAVPITIIAAAVSLLASGAQGGIGPVPHGDFVRAVALAPDGRIVVAGVVLPSTKVLVERYAEDGRPDRSFGSAGRAAGPDGYANGVAVQPDGRIVAAGGDGVVRYDARGMLDESFGDRGVVHLRIDGFTPFLAAIALNADGKILLAGTANGAFDGFLVARLLPDGRLDAGFGTAGVVITPFGVHVRGEALVQQPDGAIVVAGRVAEASAPAFVLARYLPSGALDPSFGDGGKVTTRFCGGAGGADGAFAVAAAADGRLLAAGATGTRPDLAVARYLPDGELDPTFASAGSLVSGGFSASAVAATAGGDVLVAGQGGRAGGTLARFLPDGTADESFGMLGRVDVQLQPAAMAVGDRGIVLAGNGGLALYGFDGRATSGFSEPGHPAAELRALRLGAGGAQTVLKGIDEGAAAVSPDGTRIAFVRELGSRRELAVAPIAGGPARTLVRAPFAGYELPPPAAASPPAWSPDGSQIAFDAVQLLARAPCRVGVEHADSAVFTVSVRGGAPRQLASNATDPVWSPDGRQLLLSPAVYQSGADTRVYLVGAKGGRSRIVADGSFPSWSPDGARIAVQRYDGRRMRIAVVRAVGGGGRVLGGGRQPAWSPDGRWIAYLRDCPPNGRGDCVRLIGPDGQHGRLLARLRSGVNWLVWARDGRRLVAVGGRAVLLDLHGRARELAFGTGGIASPPTWSRDSRTVYLPVFPPR